VLLVGAGGLVAYLTVLPLVFSVIFALGTTVVAFIIGTGLALIPDDAQVGSAVVVSVRPEGVDCRVAFRSGRCVAVRLEGSRGTL
jgi:hypothetical protein